MPATSIDSSPASFTAFADNRQRSSRGSPERLAFHLSRRTAQDELSLCTEICGSKMRLLRHDGHFPGLVSLPSSNVKPHDRQRAGTTTIRWPAARAERI